jgi:outer membrane protein assembly factor BamB
MSNTLGSGRSEACVSGSWVGRLVRGRGWAAWLRRGVLAAVLAAAAFAPYQSWEAASSGCPVRSCGTGGTVLWTHPLPGGWTASTDLLGTVPDQPGDGQVYAAAGDDVAAVGFGLSVFAYSARTGAALWSAALTGFPTGSLIVSVRVWPGVVTVGVARGPLLAAAGASQSSVVLAAATGHRLRSYPAAPFGGAVAADPGTTVVVGPHAVTGYRNSTGRALWSRAADVQAWQSQGDHLYVAVAPGGSLSTAATTELLRIDLRTGAEQVIRPHGVASAGFDGRLAAVLRGVVLFSGQDGVTAYSATTGYQLWRRARAVPESVDAVAGVFYLSISNVLTGVRAGTGQSVATVAGANGSGSSGVYGVRDGVALGLDLGPMGDVWGYGVASQRVVWTTRTLPWPHYFVDLSGIGGSAGPASRTVLLTACPQRVLTNGAAVCQDPELVLINR